MVLEDAMIKNRVNSLKTALFKVKSYPFSGKLATAKSLYTEGFWLWLC